MNLQIYLMTKALAEHDIHNAEIEIDHIKGLTFVNNVQLGIKYPLEYIQNINNLSKDKIYDYCFLGKFGKERGDLLNKFLGENSKILNTRRGRDKNIKFSFDKEYYQTIANAKFSLCPNQGSTEKYKHDYGWTYRLIETVFCKSMPIAFRETPYGKHFIRDINFLWNDEEHNFSSKKYPKIIDKNYKKGLEYWTLQPREINKIKLG